jgi:hypothetical protein
MSASKVCRTCEEAKPLDQFGRAQRSADGLTLDCIICRTDTPRQRDETAKKLASIVRRRVMRGERPTSLELHRAWGCRVSYEGGVVALEQDDGPDEAGEVHTHNVTLSRAEFDQVVEFLRRADA